MSGEFAAAVRARLAEVEAALAAARDGGDAEAQQQAQDQWEDLTRFARRHGVALKPRPAPPGDQAVPGGGAGA
ncbi:hypothetical protein [Microbispora sp. NPDC049125]|uniref:hypothetical protein n=1 Tax=Microbispora sp. NPDC049125 TaxID=3154929 RepID=UPI003465BF25